MKSLCAELENSPRLPQLEKTPGSSKDPAQPKIKYIKIIFLNVSFFGNLELLSFERDVFNVPCPVIILMNN